MTPYRDASHSSAIVAYATTPESILIEFESGLLYEYTRESVGQAVLELMQAQAARGFGLLGLVNRFAWARYARKGERALASGGW